MKIHSAVFEVSAPDLRSCPPPSLPEIAVIGRSNVGKSMLINMLTERRDLAKVSVTPGKTRLINFFVVNGEWRLVDLPGYGFAKGAKEERADFNVAVADYLEKRTGLLRVLVLIDSQIPPQRIDLDFLNWLAGCRVAFTLIFTKTDKGPGQVQANIARFTTRLAETQAEPSEVFACSSQTRKGRAEIMDFITRTLAAGYPRSAQEAEPDSSDAPEDTGGPEQW